MGVGLLNVSTYSWGDGKRENPRHSTPKIKKVTID
jgi:hypothetical protein